MAQQERFKTMNMSVSFRCWYALQSGKGLKPVNKFLQNQKILQILTNYYKLATAFVARRREYSKEILDNKSLQILQSLTKSYKIF